jgi:DNA-binding response OmpR family regulator
MPVTRILVVEDDPNLGQILKEYLDLKGYQATLARDGEQGWKQFGLQSYDLCIFDVMLPKKDGFTLAKEVRTVNKQVPIIFLTAKSMKEDTLQGLRLGADDYMTKPFSMEELLLRMNAILRRIQPVDERSQEEQQFTIGAFHFDYEQQVLRKGEKTTKLTHKEAGLLKLLCQHLNQTLERSLALKLVWGDDSYFNARSMDVYITKLRKYLRDDPSLEIMNIHGTGYKLVVLNPSFSTDQ